MSTNVITDFLEQYSKQYDYYSELAKIGSNLLEQELEKRGIKAIVSFRAKRPDRLEEKLNQRNDKSAYKKISDIYNDIVDLAGVRVALYFPKDRVIVDEIIKSLFDVSKSKNFPEKSFQPKFEKRFSGYWASHYRVNLKNTHHSKKRYESALFEIQVASVLMHAWSEVEHDLVYKPLSGDISDDELAILDEINGLVLTGEIALERLQKAMSNRAKEKENISNRYELTSLITGSLNKNYIKKLKLGDTKILFDFLKYNDKINAQEFTNYLEKINQSENETITDQILSMLLNDSYKSSATNSNLYNYLKRSLGNDRNISGFELFVKTWIILEKTVTIFNNQNNLHHRKYFTAKFEPLASAGVLTHNEATELNSFRQIRNNLLHGIDAPNDQELNAIFIRLIELTEKIVHSINNDDEKLKLIEEINLLRNQNADI
ncbi:GTP pyrophosphokinase [Citrobacter koseri]|nr:RelA/SpoT domain-containing protein [Citrobacter koseri]EKU8894463.1 RelA/SpoT domain-containing protein [Citrobacter koseri]HCR2967781.1 RelA/SpoT domain-containing protein [Klebsiella aerogenes]HEM6797339.1 RelA/SpoT domain-containing protein [Citrobacter koseri]